jgi:hypothetical protein
VRGVNHKTLGFARRNEAGKCRAKGAKMPELDYAHTYPVAAGIMALSTLATFLYLKNWF